MIRQQLPATIVAAVLAGFIGGGVGGLLIAPRVAEALGAGARIVTAERFVVIDKAGNMRAILAPGENGVAGLVFLRQDGKTLAGQITVGGNGRSNVTFFDENGKVEWMARE